MIDQQPANTGVSTTEKFPVSMISFHALLLPPQLRGSKEFAGIIPEIRYQDELNRVHAAANEKVGAQVTERVNASGARVLDGGREVIIGYVPIVQVRELVTAMRTTHDVVASMIMTFKDENEADTLLSGTEAYARRLKTELRRREYATIQDPDHPAYTDGRFPAETLSKILNSFDGYDRVGVSVWYNPQTDGSYKANVVFTMDPSAASDKFKAKLRAGGDARLRVVVENDEVCVYSTKS